MGLILDEILNKGAEATISKGIFFDFPVIIKTRNEKKYRNSKIDLRLRKERSIQEARILLYLSEQDFNTPKVYDFDKSNFTLIMEFIDGKTLKHCFEDIKSEVIFKELGIQIAKLHNLNIIHGDLSTSNIIIKSNNTYLIDFGLSYFSTNIEDKATDILVLKHILQSSHPIYFEKSFNYFMSSYKKYASDNIINRMSIIENRVRYKSHI